MLYKEIGGRPILIWLVIGATLFLACSYGFWTASSITSLTEQGIFGAKAMIAYLPGVLLTIFLVVCAAALYLKKKWVRWCYVVPVLFALWQLVPLAMSMLLVFFTPGKHSRTELFLYLLQGIAMPAITFAAFLVSAIAVFRYLRELSAERASHAFRSRRPRPRGFEETRPDAAADSTHVPERARPEDSVQTEAQHRRSASAMKPAGSQKAVTVLIFFAVLAGQLFFVWRVIPFHLLTPELFNNFMLLSMGMAFIPLMLALVLVCVALAFVFLLAYLPAWIYWTAVTPKATHRSARSQ
jgi:hypothetical protein